VESITDLLLRKKKQTDQKMEEVLPTNSSSWDNATNVTDIEQLLQAALGAKHRSHMESVILTLAYSLIFFTGVVGNAFTCFVITKNSYMHTATNYYLFSLAISDMLTLILGKL
jgi:neuromedin U receptor 1